VRKDLSRQSLEERGEAIKTPLLRGDADDERKNRRYLNSVTRGEEKCWTRAIPWKEPLTTAEKEKGVSGDSKVEGRRTSLKEKGS